MITRFVQELKTTRRITHPNVIRIHDFLNLNGAHAISMEYFPGRDLSKILTSVKMFPVSKALHIGVQICDGLAAAHDLGIIHRDVKPANVLVGADDSVKLVDFGLAAMTQSRNSRLTKSGLMIGTPEYMAPEQITTGNVDPRADIYSLGVLLYEMLSGVQPFTGENTVNILFRHLEADVPPLRQVAPLVSAAVERAVMGAMATSPDERPATIHELRRQLVAA
jgi:serine/threonine-protein kinase